MNTKGHSIAAPGLRGHSIGAIYPLMVVWRGTWEDGGWEVQHAGCSVALPGRFKTCGDAYAAAERVSQ